VTGASSNTTQLGVILGLIGNPDRVSFYGEIGLAERWFNVRETTTQSLPADHRIYNGGEFTLGVGVWIPAGRSFRLLPKVTVGLGSIDSGDPNDRYSGFASFAMLGLAGFYNLDL
jgi:hypothetical protein